MINTISRYPKISIAIATYKSDRTLTKVLESIKNQTYPQKKIEILIIDGGSKDNTLITAKKYNCRILKNKKTELMFAKHIAFMKAKGKYLMYLDHDEVLENSNSLKIKYTAFKKNSRVKSVLLSGYKSPTDSSLINNYINEFGDPFTYFMYHDTKGDKFMVTDWLKKYKIVFKNKDFIIFDLTQRKKLPLIELWAGGCMLDLAYARSKFPQIKKNPELVAHLFYLLNKQGNLLAITRNDNTLHYSADTLLIYLKKLTFRVKNNIYHNALDRGGYLGRERFQHRGFKFKKYLFPLYSFLIIPSLIDAFYLSIKRKHPYSFIHVILSFYTSCLIIYYFIVKSLNIKSKF